MRGRHARVFGVAAVELSPHPAHGGGDDVAVLEFIAGRTFDQSDRLDSEHTRERDIRRQTLPREQFGPVEPERLDADEHFAVLRRGYRQGLELQHFRPSRFMDDGGFHRGHDWAPHAGVNQRSVLKAADFEAVCSMRNSAPQARGGLVVEKQ